MWEPKSFDLTVINLMDTFNEFTTPTQRAALIIELFEQNGWERKQAYEAKMSKNNAQMLKHAAALVVERGRNDFKRSEVCTEMGRDYNNWSFLRYFGLVHRVRGADGKAVRGRWLITKLGWQFLRGEAKVHKSVKVLRNQIVDRSPVMVGILDVLRGSTVLQTEFDYFDADTGEMVGRRPAFNAQPENARLL